MSVNHEIDHLTQSQMDILTGMQQKLGSSPVGKPVEQRSTFANYVDIMTPRSDTSNLPKLLQPVVHRLEAATQHLDACVVRFETGLKNGLKELYREPQCAKHVNGSLQHSGDASQARRENHFQKPTPHDVCDPDPMVELEFVSPKPRSREVHAHWQMKAGPSMKRPEFRAPRVWSRQSGESKDSMEPPCHAEESTRVIEYHASQSTGKVSTRRRTHITVPFTKKSVMACSHSTLHSKTTGPVTEQLPRRAFIVNYHRLIFIMKVLNTLHDFISSTVIASLTLVQAGDIFQLVCSIGFIFCSFVMMAAHSWHYDTLEVSDYQQLCQLVGDDVATCNGEEVMNPNRAIKALAFSRHGIRRYVIKYMTIFGFVASFAFWLSSLLRIGNGKVFLMVIIDLWGNIGYMEDDEEDSGGGEGVMAGRRERAGDDKELVVTLALIGSLVLILHYVFEWLFWRETKSVLPPSPRDPNLPWDPRIDGIPSEFRWFGLPSMWFTSQAALDDLHEWISRAKGIDVDNNELIHDIYPQEIAISALEEEGSKLLRASLLHSKLYDPKHGKFLTGDNRFSRSAVGPQESPLELSIDLIFFDSSQFVEGQAFVGEYMMPEDQADVSSLTRMGTPRVVESNATNATV